MVPLAHLGQLFAELVEFLLQGGLDLLSLGHLGADHALGGDGVRYVYIV